MVIQASAPRYGRALGGKIAAEVANLLGISHAHIKLATFNGERGTSSKNFLRDGYMLMHGDQALAGVLNNYDRNLRFGQSDHTLKNIWKVMNQSFSNPEDARDAKTQIAAYTVLDALVGNTDRHHEN